MLVFYLRKYKVIGEVPDVAQMDLRRYAKILSFLFIISTAAGFVDPRELCVSVVVQQGLLYACPIYWLKTAE